jgi:DNA-binding transcriptional LysR family regulator
VITSRQLEYFRAVARELHFTRAAATLRIAQPALSQHIRKLERQLGLTLLERDRHRVQLTPAGAALLDHSERILADVAAVEAEMREWRAGIRGRIRIGTARGVAGRLAAMLAGFCATYPGVDVELREETTDEMVADLHVGSLDVATLAAPPPLNARLVTHPLGSEPLVLVTATSAPFAKRRRLPIAALDGADLALYGPGSAVREIIVSALAQAGAAPRIRFETREYSTARILASAGLAVAILPRSIAEEPGHPVHIVDLEPRPTWAPSLAWSAQRRPAPALAAFIDFVTAGSESGRPDGATHDSVERERPAPTRRRRRAA